MANSSDSAHPGSSGAGGAAGTRTLTAPIASPTGVTLPWKPSERSRPEILTKSPSAAGLWDSFRRRWILASVLGLGAAVLAVGLLWFFLPAKYEAVASIHVSSTTPSVAFPTHDTDVESYKRTQLYQIKSRPVIDAALLESKLANNPFLKGIHDKATYLSSQLNVEFPLNSEIMKITLKADQKKDLDKVVNAVVNAYIQKVVQKEKTDKQKRREDMEKRYQVLLEDIKSKASEIHTLGVVQGTTDTATGRLKQSLALKALDQSQVQIVELQRQALSVEDELKGLEIRQAQIGGVPADLLDLETEKDPRLLEIDRQSTQIETELAQLASRLPRPTSNPTYIRKKQDLESLKTKKEEVRKTVREELTRRIRLTGGADVRGGRSMEELRAAAQRLAERIVKAESDYQARLRGVNSMDNVNSDLEAKTAELAHMRAVASELGQLVERTIVEANAQPRVQIWEEAKEPDSLDLRAKTVAMIFAGFVAFGLVALGVSRLEYESRRMARAGDVTHELGLKHVGDVPSISGLRWGRMLSAKRGSADSLQDAMAESIDSIRAAIVHKATSIDGTPILLVTSAAEHEGKSTVASRLAVSLANSGRRTLLIDGHLREPQVHRTFNVPDEPGICDLLRDPDQLAQLVIRETDIPNLAVMPAGLCDEASLLALARGNLHQIMTSLAKAYRFIVIDGAPVLTVSDSLAFGEEANMALLSVRRDVSRIPRVYESSERLKAVGINVMGVVVNGVAS